MKRHKPEQTQLEEGVKSAQGHVRERDQGKELDHGWADAPSGKGTDEETERRGIERESHRNLTP